MNEHRQNNSHRDYFSKNFNRKPIILSSKRNTNWVVDPGTQVKAAEDSRRHQMSTPKSVSNRIKHHSMKQP